MKIKFRFLTGDINWQDYGGKWISQKFNNGEFDWAFVREIINLPNAMGEKEAGKIGRYSVGIKVVAPEEFNDKKGALQSAGIEQEWETLTWEQKVEIINEYSGGASVFEKQGNNYKKLFKEAARVADISEFMFGFCMDKAQNAIGNTGWDWLRGDIGYRQGAEK